MIILGGGFGGPEVARWSRSGILRDASVDVTLGNRDNYSFFPQPSRSCRGMVDFGFAR